MVGGQAEAGVRQPIGKRIAVDGRWKQFLPRYSVALLAVASVAGCDRHGDRTATIAVIPKGLTHEFWQSVHRGAERAAHDLAASGSATFRVVWDGPLRERDALEQIRIVDRRISTGVAGMVLAPQHRQTMTGAVERATRRGIPVVVIDSGLEGDNFLKYVATDNYHGGQLAAERLLATLAADGKPAPRLVLFRYAVGSESTEQREKGFEDYVNLAIERQKAVGQPTITWVSKDKYAGATKDSAMKEAVPLVNQKGADMDGIFCPNESSTAGMLDALRSLGLHWSARGPNAHAVRLVGFDSSEPLLQAVEVGDIDGLILQDPYRMGYLGVWVVAQYLNGHDVAVGGLHMGTGESVVTRDNLFAPETRGLFDAQEQAKRNIPVPEFPLEPHRAASLRGTPSW